MIPLKESSLYRIAQATDLLTTVTKPSFFEEARHIVDIDHPREQDDDTCRIFFLFTNEDETVCDVMSIHLPDGLDSPIAIDQVMVVGETNLELENPLDVDEIVTKSLCGLCWALEEPFKNGDTQQTNFFLTLISGFCLAALKDPLEIVLSLKHFTKNNETFLGLDWLWFRPRED